MDISGIEKKMNQENRFLNISHNTLAISKEEQSADRMEIDPALSVHFQIILVAGRFE
jgi:hypothetical protein